MFDGITNLTIKVGCDSGKGHTKWVASIFDSEKLAAAKNLPKNKKRRTAIVETERSDVGPLRTITIGSGPNIPENHHNLKLMMEKLKLDDLELINTGDCKVLNIQVGVGPCSSKFPCGWCEAEKVGKKMVCTQDTRMRTEENVTQNNTEWLARVDKTKDTTAQKHKSCVNLPLIKVKHESGWFLMAFPPPPLHIKIGIVIKILTYIHFYWEEMCEGTNGVDSFLASINIIKKDYFGLTLEGNDCNKVLQNLDKLERELPEELSLFLDLLKEFKQIVDKIFGFTLDPQWETYLKNFSRIFDEIQEYFPDVSETVKIHCLVKHVSQFLKKDGCKRGLAEFGEQELESAHQHFHRIWENLKVFDKFSPAFKRNYVKALAIFAKQHAKAAGK